MKTNRLRSAVLFHPRCAAAAERWLPLLFLLLPAALLLPGADGFVYPGPAARYSDMAVSHYPYGLQLQQALRSGRLPLWSPFTFSGAPFAANPLAGLWYPPGWLAFLFPLPLGFNLLALLHLAWGGLGMFYLLRRAGLRTGAALLGGVACSLLPKLYAHYGAGHLTLVYAVTWTPWLLLVGSTDRSGASDLEPRPLAFTTAKLLAPIILALIFTADPRWSLYAGSAWLCYRLASAGRRAWLQTALDAGWQALAAALLAAPLALPLLEFTRLSTRAQMTGQDRLEYSLPPARLLGLLFPDFNGFHEYILYAGLMVLILAVLHWLGLGTRPAARFWRWAVAISLAWSLGAALPLASAWFSLPGLDLLRVPSRAIFLAGLGLCALAAHTADALSIALTETPTDRLRRARLALAALAALSLMLAAGVGLATGALPLNFAWGSAFLLAAILWIGLRLGGRISSDLWLGGALLLCCIDLLGVDRSLLTMRPAAETLAEGRAAAQYLAAQDGIFRVYSPSYSLPQHTAATWGLELADGVDPMQLQAYSRYMEKATGVPGSGYSVTLPAFASGDPLHDNMAYLPDAAALGRLNVAYLVSAFPLDAPGLRLEKQLNDAYIYSNELARPRAWTQSSLDLGAEPAAPAQVVSLSPERIAVSASGPGMLVLAEIAYPGWRVTVDGRPQPVITAGGLLRAVELPAGEHTIVFTFRPLPVYAGLIVSTITLVALLFLYFRRKAHRDILTPSL